MKHFLKILDLSGKEITDLLNLADQLKYEQAHGIEHKRLAGKSLGMIFEKASTRTRVSFEVGMAQLGGYPLVLSGGEMQMGRGEPVQDTARVLSRYLDGVMIRTFDHKMVEDLAEYGSIPVINGLTDLAHPCQALADLMTIREYKGKLEGLRLCYIGDGNNVANSLTVAALKAGVTVALAVPEGYGPHPEVLAFAETCPGRFTLTADPLEAAGDADVVVTDVWASMGQEAETARRREIFGGYQVNESVMQAAKPDAMALHCLPAHREEEITDRVLEAHAGEIFDEAENRLHAQKAILLSLIENSK